VRVVHCGIPPYRGDRAASRREILDALGYPDDSLLVAHFGRLHPRKGQLDVVAAMPSVLKRHPRARFLLYPPAPESEAEEAFRDELFGRAHELGVDHALAITPTRWRSIDAMAGCDAVVVPSRPDPVSGWREGFGLVGVEAMAAGTPVVGYADGSLPEVLGDCAELVPTGAVDALAQALARVLGDEAHRDRMIASGRRRAERYTIDRAAHEMAGCYREAASPRAAAPRVPGLVGRAGASG